MRGEEVNKLYSKYKVEKTDGTPIDPSAKYFVLRYDFKSKDHNARKVLKEYAYLTQNRELQEDLCLEADLELGIE